MARMDPKIRREKILLAAIEIAKADRYALMTCNDVAEKAGIARGLITRYFGSMVDLRKEVMRRAIKLEIAEIVFQGLGVGCPIARSAPLRLKAKAMAAYK